MALSQSKRRLHLVNTAIVSTETSAQTPVKLTGAEALFEPHVVTQMHRAAFAKARKLGLVDVEDAVQAAMVKLLQITDRIIEAEGAVSYCSTAARNEVVSAARANAGRNQRRERAARDAALAAIPETATRAERVAVEREAVHAVRAAMMVERARRDRLFHAGAAGEEPVETTALRGDSIDRFAEVCRIAGKAITDGFTVASFRRWAALQKALVLGWAVSSAADLELPVACVYELRHHQNPFQGWVDDTLSAAAETFVSLPWRNSPWEERADKISKLAGVGAWAGWSLWVDALIGGGDPEIAYQQLALAFAA